VTSAASWSGGVEQAYGALEVDPREDGESALERAARIQPSSHGHRAGWNLEASDGFDPAEFAEFLEADDFPAPADPGFKERLRKRLWGMVRDNANAVAPPAPSRIGDRSSRRPLSDPNTKRPR
jgi:hypothetical protein